MSTVPHTTAKPRRRFRDLRSRRQLVADQGPQHRPRIFSDPDTPCELFDSQSRLRGISTTLPALFHSQAMSIRGLQHQNFSEISESRPLLIGDSLRTPPFHCKSYASSMKIHRGKYEQPTFESSDSSHSFSCYRCWPFHCTTRAGRVSDGPGRCGSECSCMHQHQCLSAAGLGC